MVKMLINTISFAMKETEPLCKAVVEYKGIRKPVNQWNSGHSFWRSAPMGAIENANCL